MTPCILYAVGAALFGYALGSVNFAIILSWLIAKRDIRKYGSGNAGSTNVVRTVGLGPGLATFVLDFGKGALSAWVGSLAFGYFAETVPTVGISATNGALLCGALCLLGHIFPLFFEFRGGKGVATSAGILLVFSPWALLIALGCFLLFFLPTRIISLGSLVAAASVPVLAIFFGDKATTADWFIQIGLGVVIAAAVLIRHRENIRRLLHGEEKPIRPKKKEKNDE